MSAAVATVELAGRGGGDGAAPGGDGTVDDVHRSYTLTPLTGAGHRSLLSHSVSTGHPDTHTAARGARGRGRARVHTIHTQKKR